MNVIMWRFRCQRGGVVTAIVVVLPLCCYLCLRDNGTATILAPSYTPEHQSKYYQSLFHYCPFFPVYNFSICIHDPQIDHQISTTLIRGEMWERIQMDHIRRWMTRDPDLNLLDVGANIGVYSLMTAGVGHRAVAVEPMPGNLDLLQMSLKRQSFLQSRVTVVPFAVSDGYYNMSLETDWTNPGHSVLLQGPCRKKNGYHCEKTETIMLDDLLSLPDFRTTFKRCVMKIDIEGHELRTLMASRRLWRDLSTAAVLMEWEWVPLQWADKKKTPIVSKFIAFMQAMSYVPREPSYGGELQVKDWRVWPGDIVWTKQTFAF